MTQPSEPMDELLVALQERAKELSCLYRVEELLNDPDVALERVFRGVVEAIPPGWQYPDVCCARLSYGGETYESLGFRESAWYQEEDIVVQGARVGSIRVHYTEPMPDAAEGPFLEEERRLIRTIADRLGHFILHQDLRRTFQQWQRVRDRGSEDAEWRVALNLLKKTDQHMYQGIARKMMNHMCWLGIQDAQALLERDSHSTRPAQPGAADDESNVPSPRRVGQPAYSAEEVFDVASINISNVEILSKIQKWIHEDKSSFLVKTLIDEHASLSEIADAMRRYQRLIPEGVTLSKSAANNVVVSLIRRFFTEQLDFIRHAKPVLTLDHFFELLERVVYTPGSHGKLGGKSAGLFLASNILQRHGSRVPAVSNVRVPKTWYLASDSLLEFIRHNNLEDVLEQKYKDIDQVRQEYGYIVQVFKNSMFTPEIVRGLSVALDDFADAPLIVRSSSLLEDRSGTSFPGKYKSLFLANQGTKQERLEALLDAIAEVYASTFGPDPIEYRSTRGLLDFNEQMGVMIQEVVGSRVGPYYLPLYAGVAFSNNEFRWSPRIGRKDGIVRLVPGLGTRAVDRLSDDYPVLVAPGEPALRVNTSPDEIERYSPRTVDLINLETGRFESVEVQKLLREHAADVPRIKWMVSVLSDGMVQEPVGGAFGLSDQRLLVTFDGLIRRSPFIEQMKAALDLLSEQLGGPVDIEFASDGHDLYLLQCRPQSFSGDTAPSPIPQDVAPDRIVFSAHRHVSNGQIPDITHIVFVDPDRYAQRSDRTTLLSVGRAVSKLNKLLPKRQFALMGPGRWGSRGDIKLGVHVTYSDIHNTALLIEMARQKGSYVPDLSFGTHFFQDLVESSIRYLPLYPDDEGSTFNWMFLQRTPSVLPEMLPEFMDVSDTVRVIDVPRETDGRVLRVLMNGELDEAIGILADPSREISSPADVTVDDDRDASDHWQWRSRMTERMAGDMDMGAFGVAALYLFGSTKNATAGPGSDIDLLVHFHGDDAQQRALALWLDGWSRCLAEMNYLRTGYRVDGLLDVHLVTDEDIARKTSFAIKIGAVTDAARLIRRRDNTSR